MIEKDIIQDFKKVSSKEKAKVLQRFFKTGKGEYGEGDVFFGVPVPEIRKLCKKYYKELNFDTLDFFVKNEIHEYRLFALLVLVSKYEEGDEKMKKEVYGYYLKSRKYINNWDLVDLSAPKIVGEYLKDKDRKILYKLIKSENIWDQRIAILATYTFIKNGDFKEILKFSEMLLDNKHDLIHKASGWMLREIGKIDVNVLKKFLDKNAEKMPRTMLRYSIEKFEKKERVKYLSSPPKK